MADPQFTQEHEWVRVDDDNNSAIIGISTYAQEQLGDIVFVELPAVGDSFLEGQEMLVIESVKTTGEVNAPAGCTVIAINEALAEAPQTVNESPLDDGWLIKVELDADADLSGLMDEDAYAEFIAGLE